MKKNTILFVMLMFVAIMAACIPDPPKPGFRISTTTSEYDPFVGEIFVHYQGAGVLGNLTARLLGPVTGNVDAFIGITGSHAYYDVIGGVAPASWNMGFSLGSPFCGGQRLPVTILQAGEDFGLNCELIPIGSFFTVNPSTIDMDSPPAFVTVSGSGISAVGGMPTLEYYSSGGILIAQQTASQVAEDGTWLTASTPDLSVVTSGRYLLTIRNPDGAVAGNAVVSVYHYVEPPPDPEPSPCGSGQICPIEPLDY